MIIPQFTDENVGELLTFMSETDMLLPELKVSMLKAERHAEMLESLAKAQSNGKNESLRRAAAVVHTQVQEAWDKYHTAMIEYETLRNKRDTAAMTLDGWKAYTFGRGRGNFN